MEQHHTFLYRIAFIAASSSDGLLLAWINTGAEPAMAACEGIQFMCAKRSSPPAQQTKAVKRRLGEKNDHPL